MIQPATLKFLKGLNKNNNKAWFEKHRSEYEAAKGDFENFIQQVLDAHSKNDTDLKGLEAKKCVFRIYRDVRFAKDKSPYKTNFGASMDKGGRKSGLAGYYFHLEPGKSFIGGGLWQPPADWMKKVRQEIDYCFNEFKTIVDAKKFKALFGDLYAGQDVKLSKVPQGFEKDNPAAEYLKFKSWLVLTDISDEEITSKNLVSKTVETFKLLQPFVKFLNQPLT
ncbi:MAG: TIGR02453 family protein [Chitinophagaceae bacterium]